MTPELPPVEPCRFSRTVHEPFYCYLHGSVRLSLNDPQCRFAALRPDREPVTAAPDCGRAECYIALPHAHHVRSEAGQRTRGRLEVWDAGFAAGREAAEGRTLDVAWKAVEAVLPEGWTVLVDFRATRTPRVHAASAYLIVDGDTVADALNALAAALAAAAPTPRIPEDDR